MRCNECGRYFDSRGKRCYCYYTNKTYGLPKTYVLPRKSGVTTDLVKMSASHKKTIFISFSRATSDYVKKHVNMSGFENINNIEFVSPTANIRGMKYDAIIIDNAIYTLEQMIKCEMEIDIDKVIVLGDSYLGGHICDEAFCRAEIECMFEKYKEALDNNFAEAPKFNLGQKVYYFHKNKILYGEILTIGEFLPAKMHYYRIKTYEVEASDNYDDFIYSENIFVSLEDAIAEHNKRVEYNKRNGY